MFYINAKSWTRDSQWQFAKSVSDSEPNTTQFIWLLCPIGQNIWESILKKSCYHASVSSCTVVWFWKSGSWYNSWLFVARWDKKPPLIYDVLQPKGQEISEGDCGVFSFPKNNENISLASKKWSNQKNTGTVLS